MPETPVPPLRRWGRRLGLVVLVGIAYVAGANAFLIASARATIVRDVDAAPGRRYAIVLGGRVSLDVPSAELASRLETALALYRAGRAEKIIVSGAVRGSYDEPRAMAAWLAAHGVKMADISVDPGGHRTAATMAGAAARGIRSALVVTQRYHLPRALFLARRAGIDAVGVPSPDHRPGLWDPFRVLCRETAARAESVLEVALRGVK